MRHDLAVVAGQFIVGRFGVAAIGQMVVQHAEIFHLADPIRGSPFIFQFGSQGDQIWPNHPSETSLCGVIAADIVQCGICCFPE